MYLYLPYLVCFHPGLQKMSAEALPYIYALSSTNILLVKGRNIVLLNSIHYLICTQQLEKFTIHFFQFTKLKRLNTHISYFHKSNKTKVYFFPCYHFSNSTILFESSDILVIFLFINNMYTFLLLCS